MRLQSDLRAIQTVTFMNRLTSNYLGSTVKRLYRHFGRHETADFNSAAVITCVPGARAAPRKESVRLQSWSID